ncbi:MAG: DUF2336 domain-containing protein [Rhodospirillaceae bacterium]|nr:DUF2336 domain-containing protein [Rhodospirillaceae bacterium]
MTEPEHINFNDLIGLARDKSVEGRTRLVQIVGDLFFDTDTVLRDAERNIMSDILRQLIHDVEMKVRQQLAERMASEINAPRDLISALANDQIEVAHPILTQSTILQDIELIEIVEHRTFGHQLAIAMRESVSEAVSEALIGTGNVDVIKTLLENENADISGKAMEYLVEQSEKIDDIQVPLINRGDLGPDLAKRMYWWVSAALRKHIVEHYRIDEAELDDKIQDTIHDILGGDGSGPGMIDSTPLRKSQELAEKLQKAQAITPQLLIQTLRQGEVILFEDLLSQRTGLRTNLIRRFVFEPGGEGLAIACRAVDISKADFASIFLLSRSARPGDKVVDPNEVSRVLNFFDRIKTDTALKVVKRWQFDPNFLFEMKQVNTEQRRAAE